MLLVGALGALLFNVYGLPYVLTNPYFQNHQFVKDFKQGKIFVTTTQQVHIQENTAIENAIERVKPLVATIQSASLGVRSGFVATSDGIIITLASAVPAGGNGKVFLQGEALPFTIVKIDQKNNLAAIKIEKNNLQTMAFASAEKIKPGQRVFLTAPTSVAQDIWVANEGMIRQITKDSVLGSLQEIKTTISEKLMVNGSPLFNTAGEVVGLNVIDAEGKVAAIPINKIQELLGF